VHPPADSRRRSICAESQAEAQVGLAGEAQQVGLHPHEVARPADAARPGCSVEDDAVVATAAEVGHRAAPGAAAIAGELEHPAVGACLHLEAVPEGKY